MASILSAEGLGKRYGRTVALAGVSFGLERGRVLALVGANGAGKSTLIKCVLGLVHYEGHVTVDGCDVARAGRRARGRIGYLPQHPAFHAELTVRETAVFYADLRQSPHEQARAMVELVGLGAHTEKRVEALSGGMQQRLALALALLGDPPLLVLDEPAAGLDVAARLELRHLVQEQRRQGTAVLLATHWLEDVPYVADDVLVLDRGKAVSLAPAARFADAAAPRSRLYLRLNGTGPEAVPLLRGMLAGDPVEVSGEWVVVTCPAAEKARVVGALLDAGIRILDFRVEEATLDAPVTGMGRVL